ncbi:MAG: hypothetical protein A2234_07425 [Elusimicrobia bacterium RIFOXYA2_FULL_58_8]|nr:MAG: hypothetical protein A2234_07425 [Elusimicrobia bacterium RIFOXYA2_FULL_58_8]OGS13701.1 MAG: hypothetical protein A2285_01190 [Elusimicrobia bacterium RIFOXYA12_FULL_57_11]
MTSPAQAAKKSRAAPKASDSASDEIPPQSWGLISAGFRTMFKLRNRKIESAEPNRFFPASVAFALGGMAELPGKILELNLRLAGAGPG